MSWLMIIALVSLIIAPFDAVYMVIRADRRREKLKREAQEQAQRERREAAMKGVRIRPAVPEDAARLVEIYGYYVTHTAVTFEYNVPTVEAFARRIGDTLARYPYLVLEADGAIQGYAYAGPFVGRAAYRRSCETSIYLDHEARRRGYGRLLYEALEAALKDMGILNLYACVADPLAEDETLTRDSERFHLSLGYARAGVFHKCGYKFRRWYNMIWMEKLIGTHAEKR